MTNPAPACSATCPNHDWLCELDAGHDGDHMCSADPAYAAAQRKQHLNTRVAAHTALRDVYPTAPDED
jgi:hypothetical protein